MQVCGCARLAGGEGDAQLERAEGTEDVQRVVQALIHWLHDHLLSLLSLLTLLAMRRASNGAK